MRLLALVLATWTGAVSAQANDNWANRTVITTLPFQAVEPAMAGATTEASDPDPRDRHRPRTGTSAAAAAQYIAARVHSNPSRKIPAATISSVSLALLLPLLESLPSLLVAVAVLVTNVPGAPLGVATMS